MRKLVTLPSLLALFFAPSSYAIGLGHLQLQSALGQPLELEIPIHLGSDPIRLEQMHVALRTTVGEQEADTPQQASLSPSRMIAKVAQSQSGSPVIRIQTRSRVDTPYIRLVVDLKTPRGQLTKEYTVLLDPPEFAAVNRTEETASDNLITATQSATETLYPANESTTQVPVIATAATATATAAKATKSRFAVNRVIDRIRSSAKTTPPADNQLATQHAAAPSYSDARSAIIDDDQPLRQEPSNQSAMANRIQLATVPKRPIIDAKQYGPTFDQETLWSIVQKLRRDATVTPIQMEQAILRANPDAFIGNNIHALKAGVILNIPNMNTIKAKQTVLTLKKSSLSARSNQLARSNTRPFRPQPATGKLAEKLARATRIEVAQARPPVMLTQLASASKQIPPLTVASATRADNLSEAAALATHDSVAHDALPLKYAVHTESSKTNYPELLMAMQREITDTIQRLDVLQAGQSDMVNKTTTLEAKQQNLQSFLEAKQIELAQVETRLSDLNQQLTGLLSQLSLPRQQASGTQTTTPNQKHAETGSSVGPVTSLIGFGLLASSLVGGVWYARRRQWQSAGQNLENPTLEYDDMTEAESEYAHPLAPLRGTHLPEGEDSHRQDTALSTLEEADVYLNHGRWEQAEDCLKNAIKQQPKCYDYYLKLLEVYATVNNYDAFESTRYYLTQNLQVADPDILQTIHTMKVLTWPESQHTPAREPQGTQAEAEHELDSLSASISSVFTPPLADIEVNQAKAGDGQNQQRKDSLPFSFSQGHTRIFESTPVTVTERTTESVRTA